MLYNIWIDDVRKPFHKDNLVAFTCVEDAIDWLKNGGEVREGDSFNLYLDHDLGDAAAPTGYDFCKWFIYWNRDNLYNMKFHLLTANPVGAKNMRHLLTRYGYKEF